MNYIKQLEQENAALKEQLRVAKEATNDLRIYLASKKFHGFENDYIHVSTDIAIRVNEIYILL